MAESKIFLFVVEGPTDENSLAPALERILVPKKIKFMVMHCDITSDFDSNQGNIEQKIKEKAIDEFLAKNSQFRLEDIAQIIQITDADGAFTDDSIIEPNDLIDKTI